MPTETNETPASGSPLRRTDRRVGRTLLTYAVIAIVIAFVMAAILFQTWLLFFIGLIVLVPYAILLTAPVWLARSSRVAQEAKKDGPPGPEGRS